MSDSYVNVYTAADVFAHEWMVCGEGDIATAFHEYCEREGIAGEWRNAVWEQVKPLIDVDDPDEWAGSL